MEFYNFAEDSFSNVPTCGMDRTYTSVEDSSAQLCLQTVMPPAVAAIHNLSLMRISQKEGTQKEST